MPIDFNNHPIPKTVQEAVDLLESQMTQDEKKVFLDQEHSSFHHSIGQHLRNNWGLWNGSDLKEHFKTVYGLGHADDMSGTILSCLYVRLSTGVQDVTPHAQYNSEIYKKFWRCQGIDPLTLEKEKGFFGL